MASLNISGCGEREWRCRDRHYCVHQVAIRLVMISPSSRGGICQCRQCRRQCKIFASWMGWGEARDPGGGLVRYLQLHLHQEDSVMVGEDLVYSLFATPLIVFGALSGLRKWCQRRLISGPCSYYWRRRIQIDLPNIGPCQHLPSLSCQLWSARCTWGEPQERGCLVVSQLGWQVRLIFKFQCVDVLFLIYYWTK